VAAGWDAVVLVEGISDQVALETLATRRGRDLGSEGVGIVAMGGRPTSGTSWICSARAGVTSGWPVCVMRRQSVVSGEVCNGPGWDR
jgi:Overcoming lysogenization defect protein-like, TOPRIM domain